MKSTEYPEWLERLLESLSDLTLEQRAYLKDTYRKTGNEELIRYLAERRAQWPKVVEIRDEIDRDYWDWVWTYTPDSIVEKYKKEVWEVKHPGEIFTYPEKDWFGKCIGHKCY